ncbi:uncharacterized protein LOC128260322 isoform X1 [Drosophila gunungcola]|uniref:uncharacterized protein LOC128260322 isoform X1 n=1 Tax=Drosophila gunungcola TaxID=103775 RepID=UPI0022E73E59|nr:uncharacterized protein LOC128260322 isoform X1 [Drosophila gunungcola]
MASKKNEPIMDCEFEIRGNVPKEAFQLFASAQAKTLGLRGFITQVNEELYRGQLQGEGKVIEAFKKLILAAAEYVQAIKEFIIKNLKVIQEYTYKTFEVKKITCEAAGNSHGIIMIVRWLIYAIPQMTREFCSSKPTTPQLFLGPIVTNKLIMICPREGLTLWPSPIGYRMPRMHNPAMLMFPAAWHANRRHDRRLDRHDSNILQTYDHGWLFMHSRIRLPIRSPTSPTSRLPRLPKLAATPLR